MKLAKRLELLENKFSSAEITLWMANGSTRRVRARRLIQMIPEIMSGGALGPDTTAVLASVRDNCKAVGEGHLPELLKVLYAGRGEGPRVADISILSLRSANNCSESGVSFPMNMFLKPMSAMRLVSVRLGCQTLPE